VYTIVLADAERWEELVEIMPDFMFSQVAAADLVLVNKIDKVSADKLKDIKAKIKDSGSHSRIMSLSAAKGVPEALLREVCSDESSC
jgi:G3E family GTPase